MNIVYKYTLIASFGLIIFSEVCMTKQSKTTPKNVTIWVHGTRGIAFLPLTLSKKMTATERAFCYCPRGLHRATHIDAKLVHHKHAHLLSQADPQQFPLDDFYIFGWTGDLSPQARLNAAKELYKEIEKLLTRYRARGESVHITIITHSHGGNVALNLANMSYKDVEFTIDRLIMLACPIQKETKHLSHTSIFKKVYSFYSHADLIQVGDPQKIHPFGCIIRDIFKEKSFTPLKKAFKESLNRPFFSERCLKSAPHIIQVPLKWKHTAPWTAHDFDAFLDLAHIVKKLASWLDKHKNRGLLHVEFILPMFVKQLPHVLIQAEKSPSSIEL